MDHKVIFPQEIIKAVNKAVSSVYAPAQPTDDDQGLYCLDGIVSTIYLKGDIVGKISLFIRSLSAAKIVSRMLGMEDISEDSPEVLDGVGEILNIIIGCFKLNIEPHIMHVEISVPSTRMTSIAPIGRWEHNIEQVFISNDVLFRISLSYRLALKEEKAPAAPLSAQEKLNLSATDLLKQILARKK